MDTTTDRLPRGVLHPKAGESKFSLSTIEPSTETGFFIQHYWVVKWDLRGQAPYRQTILSHPNLNLVFEKNFSRIYGVPSSTYIRLIEDHGCAVGVKFRPGGFYPFLQAPVSKLTGSSIAFEEVFGLDSQPLEAEILIQEDAQRMVNRVELFLLDRLPERDPNVDLVSDIVNWIRDDRTVVKVEDAARRTGLHIRTIQRLFDRYVGVSPKWVIQRYRLHEAAERMHQGEVLDWSELSLELGYYDQSHFIRDFKSVVGHSPEEYERGND